MKQTALEWLVEQWPILESQIPERILNEAKAMEKEQMCSFAEFVATYSDKNKNVNGEMLHAKSKYDGAERTIDLLKEYYEDNN